MISKRIVAAGAAMALLGGIGAATYASATIHAGTNLCRSMADDSLHARSTCQHGEKPFTLPGGVGSQGPKGDKGDKGDTGPAGPAGKDGTNALGVIHKTVTFNADWKTNPDITPLSRNAAAKCVDADTTSTVTSGQFLNPATVNPDTAPHSDVHGDDGNRYCFAITSTGLPKYSASQPELWGSNVSASTMGSDSDIAVIGEVRPSIGATTRTFVVSITSTKANMETAMAQAFGNSRAFTVDAWTLAVTG